MISIDNEFYQLIKKDLTVIYRYLIKMGASVEDAEDIIQDTLLKTIQNFLFLHSDNIRAWLFRVSLNNYYNLCRRKKFSTSIEVVLSDSLFTEIGIDPELKRSEMKMVINSVMEQLKDSQRTLLMFKYHMGLSCRDISKIMGTDENTVKTSLYRARNSFKKLWEEQLNESR